MNLGPLESAVEAMEDAAEAAVALIKDLAQRFEDHKDEPAKIQALADQLRASASALSSAVLANTPHAPAPPPAPAPESAPQAAPAPAEHEPSASSADEA
jgi:hypothetical protein